VQGETAGIVTGLIGLLLLAAGTLALSNRLRFPFSIALLLAGMALAALAERLPSVFGALAGLEISADLILYVFLPTLVFESAFHLDWRQLRKNLAQVLTLAVPGLLVSAFLIAAILSFGTGLPFAAALLLGAILSATDPVAVIALFRKLGAPQQLTILVEGESLFNDATSIVLARILVGIVAAGTLSLGQVGTGVLDFFVVFFGGVLVGWLMGELFGWLLGKLPADPAIQITLTTVLAYLSFLVAEEGLHVSGVMATVVAGLSFGYRGWMRVSPSVRRYLEHFWEYLAFVATALIFLMVGLSLNIAALPAQWETLLWLIGGMLLSRAAVVYGLVPVVNRLPGTQQVSPGYRTVMYWGGLRGAIALAIVLSLPDSLEFKEEFVVLVVGAVLFTLLVQGLTIDRLVHWLKLDRPPLPDRFGEAESLSEAKHRAMARLPELSSGGMFSAAVMERLERRYRREMAAVDGDLAHLRASEVDVAATRTLLYLRALSEEREHLRDLFNKGHLDERPFRLLLDINAGYIDTVRHGGGLPERRLDGGQGRHPLRRLLSLVPLLGPRLQLAHVATDYQVAWGHYQSCLAVLAEHAQMLGAAAAGETLRAGFLKCYEACRDEARDFLDAIAEQFPEFVTAMQERHALRLALLAEVQVLEERVRHGALSAGAAERLLHEREHHLTQLRALAAEKLHVSPDELLRKVPFLAELTAGEFALLARQMRPRTVPAGEDIIRAGERGHSLFLIARGVVRVVVGRDSQQHEVATLIAGDFFGEMALLRQEPRTATVRAVTPCTLYELRREEFLATATAHPRISEAVAEVERARRAELDGLTR
jgi:monovalent cation:H+ antiporter, CPA1 family